MSEEYLSHILHAQSCASCRDYVAVLHVAHSGNEVHELSELVHTCQGTKPGEDKCTEARALVKRLIDDGTDCPIHSPYEKDRVLYS